MQVILRRVSFLGFHYSFACKQSEVKPSQVVYFLLWLLSLVLYMYIPLVINFVCSLHFSISKSVFISLCCVFSHWPVLTDQMVLSRCFPVCWPIKHTHSFDIKTGSDNFHSVGKCHILLENDINISIKLLWKRMCEVQSLLLLHVSSHSVFPST